MALSLPPQKKYPSEQVRHPSLIPVLRRRNGVTDSKPQRKRRNIHWALVGGFKNSLEQNTSQAGHKLNARARALLPGARRSCWLSFSSSIAGPSAPDLVSQRKTSGLNSESLRRSGEGRARLRPAGCTHAEAGGGGSRPGSRAGQQDGAAAVCCSGEG